MDRRRCWWGGWRIAARAARDRTISTVDTETRHAHKTRSRKHDGFKAHIAAEPDTGPITNAVLTKATGQGTGDAAAGGRAGRRRHRHRVDPGAGRLRVRHRRPARRPA